MNELEVRPILSPAQEADFEMPRIEETQRQKRRRINERLQTRKNRVVEREEDREAELNPEIIDAYDFHRENGDDMSDHIEEFDYYGGYYDQTSKLSEFENLLNLDEETTSGVGVSIRESTANGETERFLVLRNEFDPAFASVLNRQETEQLITQLQAALPQIGIVGAEVSDNLIGHQSTRQAFELDQIRILISSFPEHNNA
jgi:hypothetical protein